MNRRRFSLLVASALAFLPLGRKAKAQKSDDPPNVYASQPDTTPVYCCVCQRNMRAPDGTLITGMSLQLSKASQQESFRTVYPELADADIDYHVCMLCLLNALGVEV